MPFIQASVPQLPSGIDLSGKTVIVTGATSGIGLEISRQFLTHKVSNLIMAVRNVSKAEKVRQALVSDPAVKSANPTANIKVMELDTESYSSVKSFVSSFQDEFEHLHILMANAGIGTLTREFASSGHVKNNQVNYLSNVLLTFSLLPMLEATATRTGQRTRVTWTGSRSHKFNGLVEKLVPSNGDGVVKHLDLADGIPAPSQYGISKLLVALFQLELANHYKADKVIINHFCPGMVDTSMSDVLPIYLRVPMNIIKALRARSPEKAGWIALNAAVVVGPESHGQFLEDMELAEVTAPIQSDQGKTVQKLLWNETIDEMAGLVKLPGWAHRLG